MKLTLSPAFAVMVLVLGFILGAVLALWGYSGPVAWLAFAGAGLVQLSEEKRRRGADRFRCAVKRAHLDFGEAAAIMGLTAPDLCRMLTGERKFDLWRLEMLPDEFWQEYWPLLAEDKGMPAMFQTFLKIQKVSA